MRISDWSSDVCSSDLAPRLRALARRHRRRLLRRPRPAAGARRPGRAMSRAMHRSLFARIEAKRDDLVALTRDLIRFPTVNPPGEAYTPCAEYLGARLKERGFEVGYQRAEGATGYSARSPRPNVVGRRAGGRPGPCVPFTIRRACG